MSDDFVGARAKIIALTAANQILMEDLGKRGRDLLLEYAAFRLRELSDGDMNLASKAIDFVESDILAGEQHQTTLSLCAVSSRAISRRVWASLAR